MVPSRLLILSPRRPWWMRLTVFVPDVNGVGWSFDFAFDAELTANGNTLKLMLNSDTRCDWNDTKLTVSPRLFLLWEECQKNGQIIVIESWKNLERVLWKRGSLSVRDRRTYKDVWGRFSKLHCLSWKSFIISRLDVIDLPTWKPIDNESPTYDIVIIAWNQFSLCNLAGRAGNSFLADGFQVRKMLLTQNDEVNAFADTGRNTVGGDAKVRAHITAGYFIDA